MLSRDSAFPLFLVFSPCGLCDLVRRLPPLPSDLSRLGHRFWPTDRSVTPLRSGIHSKQGRAAVVRREWLLSLLLEDADDAPCDKGHVEQIRRIVSRCRAISRDSAALPLSWS